MSRNRWVATARGSLIHRPDRQVVAQRDNLKRIEAGTPGYRPCQICQPLEPA